MHDVGAVDFPGVTDARRRWFINVAGAGYDAYVTARVPRPPTAFTYLKGALSGLATYRSPLFRITADGVGVEDRLLLAFVANARFCGNRMHVAPTAQLDDGLFDALLVRQLGLGAVLTKLARLYRGTILGDPAVRHFRAARIRIDAEPPAEVQGDGQMLGRTPVEFTVLPRALRVVIGPAACDLPVSRSEGFLAAQNSYLRQRFDAPQQPYFGTLPDAPSGARRIDMELAAIVLFGSVALWLAEEIDRYLH